MEELRVEVTRGELVESVHRVAVCVADAGGRVAYASGDVEKPVYLRSSAKPFIAAAALAAGVAERFALEPREIAVMAASHTGEPFHVAAVSSILAKIGMDERALQCGVHPPYNAAAAVSLADAGEEPSVLHNNCSGKHAGILALALAIGADPSTYLEEANPAQQRILDLCARVSGMRRNDLIVAVDGCGIPVYALPLRNAARSFALLAAPKGLPDDEADALTTVRDAMIAHPEYVSGTGEFDARLMEAADGTIACKGGAEGVHCSAALGPRLGVAYKVWDGAARGRAPGVLSVLRGLGILSDRHLTKLADLERPIVYNRAGRACGEVRASGTVAVSQASTG